MANTRKKADAGLTLFSFQDIMCCLVGVLVMISLLLALDGLRVEEEVAAARRTEEGQQATAEEAQLQIDDLRKEVAELAQQVSERAAGTPVTEQEVEVIERRVRESAQERQRTEARMAALMDEVARLEEEAAKRAEELARVKEAVVQAQLQVLRDRVRMRPGAVDAQAPFFLEVAPEAVRIGELDASRAPVLVETIPAAGIPTAALELQLQKALAARAPSANFAVFVVHAGAIARFEELRDMLYRKGYQAGWQLWDGSAGAFLERAPVASEVKP